MDSSWKSNLSGVRRAWPSLLVALGGLAAALVGASAARKPTKPANLLYECDRMLNCDAAAVLPGPSGSQVAAWLLAAVICFLGALLIWARKH
jgi:hypothetical protein